MRANVNMSRGNLSSTGQLGTFARSSGPTAGRERRRPPYCAIAAENTPTSNTRTRILGPRTFKINALLEARPFAIALHRASRVLFELAPAVPRGESALATGAGRIAMRSASAPTTRHGPFQDTLSCVTAAA